METGKFKIWIGTILSKNFTNKNYCSTGQLFTSEYVNIHSSSVTVRRCYHLVFINLGWTVYRAETVKCIDEEKYDFFIRKLTKDEKYFIRWYDDVSVFYVNNIVKIYDVPAKFIVEQKINDDVRRKMCDTELRLIGEELESNSALFINISYSLEHKYERLLKILTKSNLFIKIIYDTEQDDEHIMFIYSRKI